MVWLGWLCKPELRQLCVAEEKKSKLRLCLGLHSLVFLGFTSCCTPNLSIFALYIIQQLDSMYDFLMLVVSFCRGKETGRELC